MESIRIIRRANAYDAIVNDGRNVTTIDLAALKPEQRERFIRNLFAWRMRGFVGLPPQVKAA